MENSKYVYNNPYPVVDLGLPSGNLWAAWNVGATCVTDGGLWFAWGEAEGFKNPSERGDLGFSDSNLRNKGIFFDAVAINMGNAFEMPNIDDARELYRNTSFHRTKINGVSCVVLTSHINGNQLIFPLVGYCSGTTERDNEDAYVWLSSIVGYLSGCKCYGIALNRTFTIENYMPHFGHSVRGIIRKKL